MRKTVVITIALLIGLTVAGDLAAQAWSGSGRLKGTVVDTEGNPVKGAQVFYKMASDPDTGPKAFVTDKKGRYSFLGIKGTKWFVHAECEGYRPSNDVVADVFSNGVSPAVEMVIEKIPESELKAIARWEANQFLKKGDELRKKGKFAKARAQYETAMTELEKSDYPTVYSAMAGTYLAEGNVAEAKKVLEKSLAINGDHVASLKAMCAIVASEGDVEEAEVMLAKVPADAAIDANTLMNIGMSHYNKGKADLARPFLDRCVKTHPEHAQARYFRGLVLLNLGVNEDAADDFEAFIKMAPDSPEAAQAKEFLDYLRPAAG